MQLQHLILNNADIRQLYEEGFALRVDGNHLMVDNIPYLDSKKQVRYGTIVAKLELATPDKLAVPSDHTVYFIGDVPYDSKGNVLKTVNHNNQTVLSNSITADRYFSSKLRPEGYRDNHEKISTYADMLASQAKSVDATVSPRAKKI